MLGGGSGKVSLWGSQGAIDLWRGSSGRISTESEVVEIMIGGGCLMVPLSVVTHWCPASFGKNVSWLAVGLALEGGFDGCSSVPSSYVCFSENMPKLYSRSFDSIFSVMRKGEAVSFCIHDLGVVYYHCGRLFVFTVLESLLVSPNKWVENKVVEFTELNDESGVYVSPESGVLNLPKPFVDAYVSVFSGKSS